MIVMMFRKELQCLQQCLMPLLHEMRFSAILEASRASGLWSVCANAVLIRFVVRIFIQIFIYAVDGYIFHAIGIQTILLSIGYFAKHLTIVF